MSRRSVAALLFLLVAVLSTAACAAGTVPGRAATGAPTTTGATATTGASTPTGQAGDSGSGLAAARPVQAVSGETITMTVGQRIRLVPPADVNATLELSDFDQATFYGDELTVLALRPGTQPISLPNFDKHFDCPNGPCAHPNAPIAMTLTIVAGPGRSPAVPAPVTLSAADRGRTVDLKVGQRAIAPAGLSFAWSSTSGAVVGQELPGQTPILVGARPGSDRLSLESFGPNAAPPIDITVRVSY